MKKPLALMLLGAIAIWGCTMAVHSARAEDPPKAPEQWKITVELTAPDKPQPLKVTYGTRETGPVYFASEKECNTERTGGRKFLEALATVIKFAKEHHAEVTTACALEVKPNEI